MLAQYLGAGLGGAAVLGLYWDALRWYESQTGGYRWGLELQTRGIRRFAKI